MKRKPEAKKAKKPEKKSETVALTPDEKDELQMIMDRLSVQDPEGGSLENYLKSLRQALGERPHLMAGLLDLLSRSPSKVGFRAFRLLRDSVDREYSRLVKQAAYRFAQRGHAIESPAPAQEKVVLIQREVREPVAHASRMDSGVWLLSAILPDSEGFTPRMVVAIAENGFKTIHAAVNETSYKNYREYVTGVAGHMPERRPLEIPLWHMARLFFEMLGYHGENAHPAVQEAAKILRPHYDPERRPYAFDLLPEIENPEGRFDEVDPEALVAGVDVSWLYFSKNRLAPYKQKLDELDSPVLVIPPEVQKERSYELLRRAGNELCTGETLLLFRRFFEEQALWLKLNGNDKTATMAWIVARHLAGEGEAGGNPVVPRIVISSIGLHYPEQFESPREEPGQEEQEAFRRTDSGLFIP